jgi:putative ABC transport system permease protein
MLAESVVLGGAGGVAGLVVATMLHRGLLAIVESRIPIPRIDQVTLDLRVVAFTVIVALATGIAFGLVPALMSAGSASDARRESGRHIGGRRLQRALNALVVAEVAMSLVLLVGAGLLMRSFINQRRIDTGYRSERVLAARVQLPGARYDGRRATQTFNEWLTRVSALPGVEQAAAASCLPPPGGCAATTVWRLDAPLPTESERTSSQIRPISPEFFRTMGISQLAGRDFSNLDTATSAPVAIVSESVRRDYFAGANPLDIALHINTIDHANGSADMPWTIVGVVRDIRSSVDGTSSRIVYVPITQIESRSMTFFVRTASAPMSLATTVTRIVHDSEPEAPVDVRTLEDIVAATIARPRALMVLVSVFAGLALTLAAIGVYGVIAFSVRERTREIGVRLALGATMASVARMVLSHALRLAAMGVVAGSLAAAGLTRLLERLLFSVEPLDPWTFALTPLVLLGVAGIAAYLPARRGMRTAPADALRAY